MTTKPPATVGIPIAANQNNPMTPPRRPLPVRGVENHGPGSSAS